MGPFFTEKGANGNGVGLNLVASIIRDLEDEFALERTDTLSERIRKRVRWRPSNPPSMPRRMELVDPDLAALDRRFDVSDKTPRTMLEAARFELWVENAQVIP